MGKLNRLQNRLQKYPMHVTENGLLVRADNMDIINSLPDNFFDLLLTDPPYGIGEDGERNHSRGSGLGFDKYDSDDRDAKAEATMYTPKDWDNSTPDPEYFKHAKRISDNQIIFGGNYYQSIMIETDEYKFSYDSDGKKIVRYLKKPALGATPCWVIWNKQNAGAHFADCEMAWASFDTAVRRYDYRWNGMLRKNWDREQRFHPTQKPIGLMREILKDYAEEGDWILDTHAGSCCVPIAANDLGMNYFAIEIDEEYFNKSKERIEHFKHGWYSKTTDTKNKDPNELPQSRLDL